MGLEQPIGSDQPWETVLSAAPVKPFTFFIVAVAGDGSEARIANTDGTVTVLIGTGLTAHGSTADGTGARARLTGGRIGELRRLDGAGELLESVSGLDIAAGGPSRLVSFSRPDGSMTSLAWARQLQVQFKADAAASAPRADACAPAAQIAIPAIPATPANPAAAGLAPSALDLSVSNRIHTAPPASARRTRSAAVVFASAAAGIATVGLLGAWLSSRGVDVELDQLRTRYTRPTSIPYPADNVPTQARVDLGRRLFSETLLSANGEVSCASCHKAELAFSDGVAYGRGITGRPLKLHTQSLWNVAWGRVFFWDGRSTTLESQARDPMANPEEMGQPIEAGAAKLAADPSYKPAFAAAFPENPSISPDTIVKALASYERTLVSPPTRFDRWVGGDARALSTDEIAGFRLFNGKARCASCHSGWSFTDYAFHDIGLAAGVKGRGAVLKLAALDYAFKTPSLRELAWTSPYMHDGSLATLEAVVRHYETGGVDRPNRSPDMPRVIDLSELERGQLVAFLGSLSADQPVRPSAGIELAASRPMPSRSQAIDTHVIGQKDKLFAPGRVRIRAGESLVIMNNDSRPHNVRISHPKMNFISDMQFPGDKLTLPFALPGTFEALCGIHPNMRLTVEVHGPDGG